MALEQRKCRGCGAPIFWAKTPAGKWLPLEAAPGAEGLLIVVDGRIVSYAVNLQEGQQTYRAHWRSCPFAGQQRQPKGKKRPKRS
jgi:hypothetical protein